MILTTHALTGAVIGKNLDGPYLIIIVSIAIHYLMDTLRHGEYLNNKSSTKETLWKVFLDIFAGLTIIALILYYNYNTSNNLNSFNISNISLGVFFSMFPDFLTFLYWKMNFKFLKKLYDFHTWIHKYPPFSPQRAWNFQNSINDIFISATAIVLLLFF
ncbi:MAG: hypothetical protein PHH24_02665 [Candidatus Moranbacteria bacterium]|nr:hypothetical protein [Candidatus Moranbacteria bacterium]